MEDVWAGGAWDLLIQFRKCGGGQEKITDFDRVSYLYSWWLGGFLPSILLFFQTILVIQDSSFPFKNNYVKGYPTKTKQSLILVLEEIMHHWMVEGET